MSEFKLHRTINNLQLITIRNSFDGNNIKPQAIKGLAKF